MTNPLTALFDRIVIINLPQRSDRRAEMSEQLQRVGLRLDASPVRLFAAIRPSDPGGFPSIGARGCFLSHLGALRDARADGVERLLILEDDCDFAAGSRDAVLAPWRDLAELSTWDICYGGYRLPANSFSGAQGWTDVAPITPVSTTHCIGFASSSIEVAVPYLEGMLQRAPGDPEGGPMHVDGAYTWLRRAFPHLRTVAAVPPLAFQRASRTDIHDLRWYDANKALRPIADTLRRLLNRSG